MKGSAYRLGTILLFGVLVAVAPVAVLGAGETVPRFQVVRTPGFEGAIVPASIAPHELARLGEAGSYWTPARSDVERLEARLPEFVHRAVRDTPRDAGLGLVPPAEEIRAIDARLGHFRRQYIGVIRDGRRQILLSAFPVSGFPDWDRRLVVVLGGGCSFWRAAFDLASEQFVGLGCNARR